MTAQLAPHVWDVDRSDAGHLILRRDRTPVARFYAKALTVAECVDVAAKLNREAAQ